VITLGKKSQTQSNFDAEKSVWYYQPQIYINSIGEGSLYNELKDFRESLSREDPLLSDSGFKLKDWLIDPEEEEERKRRSGVISDDLKIKSALSFEKQSKIGDTGFFYNKLELLKKEIEEINSDLSDRKEIENIHNDLIDKEINEIKLHLHEIYTHKNRGSDSTIEFIRLELTKLLASLYREKRSGNIGVWKDSVFEKKDRRELLFEYHSLKFTDNLTGKGLKGGAQK
jgi:hypothetical protein